MPKILISGESNSGKTTLLQSLKDVFVVARDGKPYPFPQPHTNIGEFRGIMDLRNIVGGKIEAYSNKHGKLPEVIAFDSISNIYNSTYLFCRKEETGFNVFNRLDEEVEKFIAYQNKLSDELGMTVLLLSHCIKNEHGRFVEPVYGKFNERGGFLSTVDYALYVQASSGKNRRICIYDHERARTAITDKSVKKTLKPEMAIDDFNLQAYIDLIKANTDSVKEFEL